MAAFITSITVLAGCYALAAIAWRRTLSLFVRSIAVALPMLAVSVYPLVCTG